MLPNAFPPHVDLVELTHDAIFVRDLDSIITYWNHGAETVYGWTRAEAVGQVSHRLLQTRFPPLDAPVDTLILRDGAWEGELAHIRRDGRRVVVDSRQAPVLDAAGRAVAILETNHDITERKQAEVALQQSRDELQAILASVADGVLVQNAAGRIVYANDVAARLCGFSSVAEFLATPIARVLDRFKILDEGGQPLPWEKLPARLALQGMPSAEVVVRSLPAGGGEELWAVTRARPVVDERGRVRFAVSAFQDITALKRQEIRDHFLAEAGRVLAGSLDPATTLQEVAALAVPNFADWCVVHLHDGVDRHDTDGRNADADHAGGRGRPVAMAHADPAKLALGRELEERFPAPADAPAGYPQVLRTGKSDWIPDVSALLIDESRIDPEHLRLVRGLALRSSICAPLIARGRILGAITFTMAESGRRYTLDDLTLAEEVAGRAAVALDNARLYEEARRALAEAEVALAARDRFLSMASHELRTPLASLSGYLQLIQRRLQRGTDARQLVTLVDQARQQGANLAGLIDDLLDVTRIATGHFVIRAEPLALTPLLNRVVELARAAEPPRRIDLDLPEPLPEIEADAARLEQVFVNLLENARKYSPEETPIRVTVAAGPDTVSIAVQDRGVGIPLDDQPHIFEPFHRGRNVDARKVIGLGLGLSIAHEIAAAHGGILAVQSEPGQGSTFTLTLPRPPSGPAPAAGS